ncbi:MAG TPA: hypothetical protein VK483_17380 [Chitinophagaceae bacterium]|nr:hypothetical protein [Chitinophagaceae bacterium]
MANKNPIYVDQPAVSTEFVIPKEYANTRIYFTISVELEDKDWKYAASHNVFLDGSDFFPQTSPEPEDLKLEYAKNLDGAELDTRSHISRFNFQNTNNSKPSIVKYKLIIEAGDELIDEFEKKSKYQNPVDFNSIIKFKLEL